MDHIHVEGNTVHNAGQALLVGYSFDTQIMVTSALIVGNTFQDSTAPSGGQISLIADVGNTIEARIANNVIHGGSGYGIWCLGVGTFLLTALLMNDFAGNAQGDISGCL